MRRITLIHCGAASLIIGGVVAGGMFASGCGGDDNGGSPGGEDSGPDGTNIQPPGDDGPTGSDVTTKPPGDGGPGSSDAADAAPPVPVFGKVIVVNAAGYAPALRFCYGSVNGDAGTITIVPKVYPAPNTALGVPPGTGGPAAESPVDLKDRTLEIYAIATAAVAGQLPTDAGTELTCDKLIGDNALAVDAGGLPPGSYWDLGTLPAGTLADGTTTLLAVTGCAPGEADNPTYNCPMPYPAAGNLGMSYARLDNTTPLDGGSIGAQFAYASFQFASESTLVGGAAVAAGFYVTSLVTPEAGAPADGGDAAVEAAAPVPVTTVHPIAVGATYGQFDPRNGQPGAIQPMTLAPVSGVTFDGKSGFFVNAITADGGPTVLQVPVPLPSIQAISAPNADAGIFADGVGYVFVLVGDPGLPSFTDAGQFNVLSAHILGFPTNPPFGN
jgi:hypothetical protein